MWHTLLTAVHPWNMSRRIYPAASCFWLWRNQLLLFFLRSLSSFVPSCTRSSLMSSSTRWWNRWFQHLSIVLPKFTVQRRPSLASWCSTKFTIRSICTKGWWSRRFHWHLWSLSHNSDQAFIPEPCYLKPVWSPVLFSYCCFVRQELPHQQTSFINLSEWSMWRRSEVIDVFLWPQSVSAISVSGLCNVEWHSVVFLAG